MQTAHLDDTKYHTANTMLAQFFLIELIYLKSFNYMKFNSQFNFFEMKHLFFHLCMYCALRRDE